jgi:predicted nucleic acid-binding protein
VTVLLDSSGWIELLGGTKRADLFEPVLKAERLIVPSIVRYEVGRSVLVHSGEAGREMDLRAMAKFEQVAVDAAAADAIVYAVARAQTTTLKTCPVSVFSRNRITENILAFT